MVLGVVGVGQGLARTSREMLAVTAVARVARVAGVWQGCGRGAVEV